MRVDPARVQPLYPSTLAYYFLGADLDRFTKTSYVFLIIEEERGGDNFTCSTSNAPTYGVPIDTGASGGPPWTGPYSVWGNLFSFRHVRPRSLSLYQTQATANFAFLDCHVETFFPTARIQVSDRTDRK